MKNRMCRSLRRLCAEHSRGFSAQQGANPDDSGSAHHSVQPGHSAMFKPCQPRPDVWVGLSAQQNMETRTGVKAIGCFFLVPLRCSGCTNHGKAILAAWRAISSHPHPATALIAREIEVSLLRLARKSKRVMGHDVVGLLAHSCTLL